MRIAVCVRQGLDGELNPFDASAYEIALSESGAEVIPVSMGVPKTADLLLHLTRLGASRAILLSDPIFAGSDTLATAYVLSRAMEKLKPDRILCGRKTLIGDTGQVPPMLAEMAGYEFLPDVLTVADGNAVTREGNRRLPPRALLAAEKQAVLRLPSLLSRVGTVETWNAADIGADPMRCGLNGSPTRVLETRENTSGRRKCRILQLRDLPEILAEALRERRERSAPQGNGEKLPCVLSVGSEAMTFARTVCDNPQEIPVCSASELAEVIAQKKPDAVLFGNDPASRETAARLAAREKLGLCADCTAVTAENGRAVLYRPALSGSLIAKIVSETTPALATVRCRTEQSASLIVAAGYGVRKQLDAVRAMATRLGADFAVSRKLVDGGFAPYREQVGLTGKTVSPAVYLAVGISGAVHHLAGMDRSGTVIAVNPDPHAPIFDYADYGIRCSFEELEDLYHA